MYVITQIFSYICPVLTSASLSFRYILPKLRGIISISGQTVEPIFHCYTKPFTLGTFASPEAKGTKFASTNAKDTNMLLSFALGDANFSHHPMQDPNASPWNIGCVGLQTQNPCIGHVHFMLFVSISFAFGSKRKRSF